MIRSLLIAVAALAACTPAPPAPAPSADAETPEAAPVTVARYKPAPEGEITVLAPASGARVMSPLVAEGSAINTWFFEGQFVAELLVDGEVIAQGPAMQAGETAWTDPGPVQFRAEIAFDVTRETAAELILSEDMPEPISPDSDERGPARSVTIPVVLLPPAQ